MKQITQFYLEGESPTLNDTLKWIHLTYLYEKFLEFKYFFSSKLENCNEENIGHLQTNGNQRSLETKIQLLENENQNLRLYVLVMSRTLFRVNPHSIFA